MKKSTVKLSCLYGQNVLRGCDLISLKDSIRSSPLATGFCILLFEPLCIPYQLFILFCIFYLLFSPPISVLMGPMTVPSQSPETIKIPTAHYEFGANFIDHPKLMLFGRVLTDGRLNARVKCDLTDNLTLKANAQLTNEPHMSHGMASFDYKGSDYRSQIQVGNGALLQASYIQSVTPHFSLGGEVFWAGQHRKSGIGYAARFSTEKMVATGQVASTGMVALSYVQKLSEKVSLASDLMYNHTSRDVTASVGYDYVLRQSRLRGKIDSNGCTAAFLEERLSMGLKFILSAEMDHKKKDYKFGFGLAAGE
ncbi:unnamed protein product [Prunus armeniaca]